MAHRREGKGTRRRNNSYCDSEYQVEKRRTYYTRPDTPFRCHQLADSLFSTSSGFNNYRGILNLCIILLALTTGRVALENVLKYGILIDPIMWMQIFISNPYSWPCFFLVLFVNVFVLIAFAIELQLAEDKMSETVGKYLHIVNLLIAITFPAVVVLYIHPSPFASSPALGAYIIVFLKLISYKQVNKWCREYFSQAQDTSNDRPKRGLRRTKSHSHAFPELPDEDADDTTPENGKRPVPNVEVLQIYPQNLYLKDLYYFVLAPTLCYELNFPRSARIRKHFLIKRFLEMMFLAGLMLGLIQQWIIPTVNNSMIPFKTLRFSAMVERMLKLAVPNHFIWLIFFYWLFHSSLNFVSELLRFGDRVFYKDWWNADSIQGFWQTWNIPVHKWASRHLYKPMLMKGFSKLHANIFVFFVSAFFHEYLVSIPLQMFRLWAFTGLLAQIPLAIITHKYLHGKFGNMVMWMSLIIGQPVAILMYYHDYYVLSTQS